MSDTVFNLSDIQPIDHDVVYHAYQTAPEMETQKRVFVLNFFFACSDVDGRPLGSGVLTTQANTDVLDASFYGTIQQYIVKQVQHDGVVYFTAFHVLPTNLSESNYRVIIGEI